MTVFTDHTGFCLRILSHVFQSVKIDVRRRITPPPHTPALAMIGRCDEHGIVQKILILNSDLNNATNPASATLIRFGLR